jgi:LmbE family N-acetylglucosaminyl deacetylase
VVDRLVAAGARVVAITCTTGTLEDLYAAVMAETMEGAPAWRPEP